jgi:hypothetical protein
VKILLVNDYAVPQGGAEILILSLRGALRERGHDARLFTSNAGENGRPTLADYSCRGTTSRFLSKAPSIGKSMGGYGASACASCLSAGCRARKDVPDAGFLTSKRYLKGLFCAYSKI